MLAKIWKKILFAICIIACIYNVMSKIVNRHSLEENLKSVNDGEVVFEVSEKNAKSGTEITITNNTYLNEMVTDSTTQSNTIAETGNVEQNKANENTSQTTSDKFLNLDFLF